MNETLILCGRRNTAFFIKKYMLHLMYFSTQFDRMFLMPILEEMGLIQIIRKDSGLLRNDDWKSAEGGISGPPSQLR